MATEQTRHEAADPRTSPARLQELTSDPELWALIAANPSAYDSLVAWLGENGGDDVRRAVASRGMTGMPVPVPAGPTPTGSTPGGPRKSTKGLWITLGVLVFLLLGGGVGAGVWALTKDDSSTKSDDGDDQKTPDSEDTQTDTDKDEDEDEKDEDTKSAELDCQDLEDLEDAAGDVTLYYPGIDDESDLEDAVDVIQEYEGHDDRTIADAVDALLEYAEKVAEDEDEMYGPAWEDALDAEFEIYDLVLDEC